MWYLIRHEIMKFSNRNVSPGSKMSYCGGHLAQKCQMSMLGNYEYYLMVNSEINEY